MKCTPFSLTNFWWLFILMPYLANSSEYRYPVAILSDNNHVLVLSQQNRRDLELSLYDRTTKTDQKILSSRHLPAGVQLLPDESGFSFIDDGILCVKKFDRRSARMIEPSEPLYAIEYVHWLDNESCYFHAMAADHNGIYMMNIDGTVTTVLAGNNQCEYLYPHIISGVLFCIVRNKISDSTFQYSICKALYQELMENKSSPDLLLQPVITIGKGSLALLHITSSDQGFVLEYPPTRDSQEELFPITCFSFSLIEGQWQSSSLFTYYVPSQLLFDPIHRLYESILPLMPFYGTELIYYCSCAQDNKSLGIYSYSLTEQKTQRLIQESASLLRPFAVGDKILYGGEANDNDLQAIKVLQIDPGKRYA